MLIKDILSGKGNVVHCIGPEATLREVVERLAEHNVGGLVVRSSEGAGAELLGIITERDVTRHYASGKRDLESSKVADVMTAKVVTIAPDEPIEKAMAVMTEKRLRHLPVKDGGKLVGLVSIGDVVKAQFARLAMENKFMRDYIQS